MSSYIDRRRRYLQPRGSTVPVEPQDGTWQVEVYTPIGWRHVGLALLPLKWRASNLSLDSALLLMSHFKTRRFPGDFRAFDRTTKDILMGVVL